MISHKHKCIFIHIPKTAGTSINSFFHPGVVFHYKNPDYERLFGWCPKRKLHMQHATSKQLLETELITESQWKTYYKFAFVRNPWDRAYSDYLFIKDFAKVNGSFKEYITKKGEFNKIFTDNTNENYLGDHLQSQSSFLDLNGKNEINFIGRFENFSKDILKVLSYLEINKNFDVFQNKSKNRIREYSNFYTNSNKKLIESIYNDDINLFNYTFEDKRKGINSLKKFF
mgnify:CR=1 FL=1